MIDFVKIIIIGNRLFLIDKKGMEFNYSGDTDGGELKFYSTKKRFKHLKFSLTPYRSIIEGSLHKYYTNGVNWNNFNRNDLAISISNLCKEFSLNSKKCRINSIEIGVNIITPFDATYKVIKGMFIAHFNRSFNDMDSRNGKIIGVDCKRNNYTIKIYSKKDENSLFENILRFEIHISRIQHFLDCHKHIYLSDLLSSRYLELFKQMLIKTMKEIIVFDNSLTNLSKKDNSFIKKARNPLYWSGLKSRSYRNNARKRFYRIIQDKSNYNIQANLVKLVEYKCNELIENRKKQHFAY